ncbi:helix-turn-helix transcriptional regulator [Actinocorallia sp. API 0066]|uniref:helix-turn-helix domain-containing protein n=1 Tax=Actinocorallia sp. API 0066 TaxID=2896846 RepID=UPI001E28831C|nr:helix-turn-helix transcriptional regulator [Actinocorallia sp. API 0066]MCD0447886.1 helix-turn-helix transcriptional regulator [Actinocorallia sp. API 0066]
MTTPAENARRALGVRLREIRKDAGLTGRALADACGWHFTKISKIEGGGQTPSEENLRDWCRTCGAEDQTADLIATVRSIDSMYLELRRTMRTGMRHKQKALLPLYERTRVFRAYEPGIVPGLLQTAEYAAAIIGRNIEQGGFPNDLDQAVAARMERQKVLYSGDRRFLFVLEEQALRTRVGNTDVMTGQLDRLLAVMSLQRVSLGVVPAGGERRTWPSVGFWIFDEHTVRLETPSAELTITQEGEIAVYLRKFQRHQTSAVLGNPARDLISQAMRAT